MELKNGYKRTDIGIIPEDWEIKKLYTLGTFSKGKGIKKDEVQEYGIPCVRYGELYTHYDNTIVNFNSFINSESANQSKKIKYGDILFAGSGETKEDIGKSACLLSKLETYAGGDIIVFTPKETDPILLGYLLNSIPVKNQKSKIGQGDAVVHIYSSGLKNIQIPLPSSTEEQKAIAQVLTDTDQLIQNLKTLIAKKKAIKQGAMQELLTGKKKLKGFSEKWEEKRLGEVLSFQVGYPFLSIFFNDKEGVRLIKNRDLKNDGKIVLYSDKDFPVEYIVENGDVLIGMDGDFIPCLWKKGIGLLNQRIGRLVSNKVDLTFFYYFLIKPLKDIEEITSSTTVKHLSHSDIEELVLPIPSIQEQKAIAQILSDMDSEIEALETQLQKTENLKQGMMQELLTGKIRLVEPVS